MVSRTYNSVAVDASKVWWKEQQENSVIPSHRSLKYVDKNGALQCTGSIDSVRSGHTRNRTHEQKTESQRKASKAMVNNITRKPMPSGFSNKN
jgi:hypothetical protein